MLVDYSNNSLCYVSGVHDVPVLVLRHLFISNKHVSAASVPFSKNMLLINKYILLSI